MKKTININLGGTVFHIDEDAFTRLENYLNRLQKQLAQTPGRAEIVSDVELRIAELFQQKQSHPEEVIPLGLVEEVIAVMGKPEDYLDSADAGETAAGPAPQETFYTGKKLFRDPDSRILGGVASGLAHYFGIDVVWIRLLFIALFFTGGLSFLVYVVLWLAVPKAHTTADRLRMQGQPVNLNTIEAERQYPPRSRSSLGRFLSGLGLVLGRILRFLLKLVGILLLLAIGTAIVSAIFAALFYSGPVFQDMPLRDMLPFILPDSDLTNILTIGLLLTGVPLLIFIIHFAIQLINQSSSLHPNTRNGMLVLIVVGVGMTLYASLKVGRTFNETNHFTQRLPLDSSRQYHVLQLRTDSISTELNKDDGVRYIHLVHDSLLAVQDVDFDIQPSDLSYSYLATEVSSHGPTEREATQFARQVAYQLDHRQDTLYFQSYFLLPRGARFRAQEVNLTLYLRPGDTLFLAPDMESIVSDIDNVHNTWDWDMGGYRWYMTAEGLTCVDCPPDIKRENTPRDLAKDLENSMEELERRAAALESLDIRMESLSDLKKLEALKELDKLKQLERLQDTTIQNLRIQVSGDKVVIKSL